LADSNPSLGVTRPQCNAPLQFRIEGIDTSPVAD
jgi:hypothetical protein